MNKRNKLEVPFYEIGELTYHDKKENINREFDIVTKDDNGYIYYECKYYQNKVSNKDIEAEIKQANSSKLKFYKFGFFSRRGFEKSVDGKTYILFTLKDIFNLE